MKKSYCGNLKPFAAVLMNGRDRETVLPILEELSSAGRELCYGANSTKPSVLKRSSAVLAFFTENSVKDTAMQDAVLSARNAGIPVIPVLQSEDTRLPDLLQPFFGASNAVFQSRYDAKGLADRLLSADSLKMASATNAQKKAFKTTVGLLIAAAVLVLAGAGYLIYKSAVLPGSSSTLEPAPTPAATAEPSIPKELEEAAKNAGITAADLNKIQKLYLVGGHRLVKNDNPDSLVELQRDDWDEYSDPRYIWIESYYEDSGTAVESSRDLDLSFLPLLKNLRELVLIGENGITELPDLSGLENLSDVQVSFCPLQNVKGLANCDKLRHVKLEYTDVADLSPLNSCESLIDFVYMDKSQDSVLKNLSGFAPKGLHRLHLKSCWNLEDLSSLSEITDLVVAELEFDKNIDLSFLGNQKRLLNLSVHSRSRKNTLDLSALQRISSLGYLRLEVGGIDDLSFVCPQKDLEDLVICVERNTDFSKLSNMIASNLNSIWIEAPEIQNLSFLKCIQKRNMSHLNLHAQSIGNYLALSTLRNTNIDYLGISLWDDWDYGELAPYIEQLSVGHLSLNCPQNLDFSRMPKVSSLEICNANDLENLEGIEVMDRLGSLNLQNCRNLRSLSGLEKAPRLYDINLDSLPTLEDVEALYSLTLSSFGYRNMTELLPDFSRMNFSSYINVAIESIPLVENLEFLNAIPKNRHFGRLSLNRLFLIEDPEPLFSLAGDILIYPGQLKEQIEAAYSAQQLNFKEIQEGDPFDGNSPEIPVASMEELETMSPVKKLFIRRLRVAGGTVLQPDEWSTSYWEGNQLVPYVDHSTNEPYPAGKGTIQDLTPFKGLDNLETLWLEYQPIESIEGIQDFENLREVSFCCSRNITDFSPLFALNNLKDIHLCRTGVTSIEGVQNLTHLRNLCFYETKVTDLSPLKDVDYTEACEQGGFRLNIDGVEGIEDYSALSAVPKFRQLYISIYDKEQAENANWIESVRNAEIYQLEARDNSFIDNEYLKAFLDSHPELEELCISWNRNLTDLTPLLNHENLRRVRVSEDMKKAIASLDGEDYSFELQIEG